MTTTTRANRHALRLFVAFVGVLLFAHAPIALQAIEIVHDEDGRTESRSLDEDYLFAGESLDLTGSVESLFFAGETLSLSGDATGNLVAAGERVEVSGSVGDDSIVAGKDVIFDGRLGSTVFAAGETVTIEGGAEAAETVFAAGGTVRIRGRVSGDLYSGAKRLVITGRIDGDVHAGFEEIEFGDGASIGGDLIYWSDEEVPGAAASVVSGSIERREKGDAWDGPSPWIKRLGKRIFGAIVALSMLVFTLVFYLFPGLKRDLSVRKHRRFWITVAWGLLPFFLYPVAVGLLFLAGILLGITIPIALAMLFGTGLVVFVLAALALPEIGMYVAGSFKSWLHDDERPMLYRNVLLGFAVIFVAGLIPVVDGLVGIVFLSFGWGVALERLFAVRFGEK